MQEVFLALYLTVSLIAMFLVVGVLLPGLVKTSRQHYEKTPARSFWLGLVNVLFLGAITVGLLALMQSSGAQFLILLAAPLAALVAFGLVVGAVAVTQYFGERLFPKLPPIKQNMYGSLVAILACLLPFVGWFLLSGYLLIAGFGGVAISFYEWRSQRKTAK